MPCPTTGQHPQICLQSNDVYRGGLIASFRRVSTSGGAA